MIPRNRLDIDWADIFFGLNQCLLPTKCDTQTRLENLWSARGNALACLSVRTGFDALLMELKLPAGSEIMLSAITIRDMVRIIEHHGLVAVPVDLDMTTLCVKQAELDNAFSPRSRALLIAHLFGSRIDMAPYAAFAQRHNLLLLEDCAQAFCGDGYRGHPDSDVSMFSFGTIKAATAFGGALLRFKDKSLAQKIRLRIDTYSAQSRGEFFIKLIKNSFLQLVSTPILFTLFAALCKLLGTDHDLIISRSVRGFPGTDFFQRIRRKPAPPLLALLLRRLQAYGLANVAQRIKIVDEISKSFPSLEQPGSAVALHTHWVMPVLSEAPDDLVRHLWRHGFDATRGASSMSAVARTGSSRAHGAAANAMERMLYLPLHPAFKPADAARIGDALAAFHAHDDKAFNSHE
jgi:perosamine synthetase